MSDTIGPSLAFYLRNAADMDTLAAYVGMSPEGVTFAEWSRVKKVIYKAQAQARALLVGPAQAGLSSAAERAGLHAWGDSGDTTIQRYWAYWMAVAAHKDGDGLLSLGVAIDWPPDNKPWLGVALDFYKSPARSRQRAARVLQKHGMSFRETVGWNGWRGQLLVGTMPLDASTLLLDCESWVAMTAAPLLTELWPELTGQSHSG
ncbi:hypothetical protein [Corallococcus coralloides]|uniref:hypothetical protein n=1 Tax=Corallococcus coralloides TaxID=184914 RepID=UPI0011D1EF70|nr:hypothetical protein [Corallococcus coralloides]